MTPVEFETRAFLIANGCCPRCAKPVQPWPLKRADHCHIPGAVVCPRQWEDIHRCEARLQVTL